MTVHLNLSFRSVMIESNHSLKSRTASGFTVTHNEASAVETEDAFYNFYLSLSRPLSEKFH